MNINVSPRDLFFPFMYVNILCTLFDEISIFSLLIFSLLYYLMRDYTGFALIALTVQNFLIVEFVGPGIRVSRFELGFTTHILVYSGQVI